MFITDHINFFPEHPLRGKNFPTGPRFPDMSAAYNPELLQLARTIAQEKGIRHVEGVYVGTQGPTFETPAEYRMYHRLGGDAVGMSTVPEVIRGAPHWHPCLRHLHHHRPRRGRQDC